MAVAAVSLLPFVLAACFGGGRAGEDAGGVSSSEPGPIVATGTTESGEGWTNYVPLAEAGDAEPSFRSERATCSLTEFRVLLDVERGVSAVLDEGGNVVASITTTTRDIADSRCRTSSRPKRYQGDQEAEVAYDSGGVRCRAREGIEIETFPILDGRDDVWGSNLVVSVQGRPLAIAGAITVQDTNGRRLYYLPRYCEPL